MERRKEEGDERMEGNKKRERGRKHGGERRETKETEK